jgi:hypothetical protein
MKSTPVRKSTADYSERKEKQLRQYDALYNFLTTPNFADKLKHIDGLEKYVRAKYKKILENEVNREYNDLVDETFAFLRQNNKQARMAQAYFVFYMICAESSVAQHFVPLPPSDPRAPDPARCDRWAFEHFVAIAAEKFTEALVTPNGSNFLSNVFSTTHYLIGLYAMLMPSQPLKPTNRPASQRTTILPKAP